MGKESEDLEDEEAALEQESVCQAPDVSYQTNEKHDIGMFGHRFLLPFGRRQTQMELDAAPVSFSPLSCTFD